MADLKNEIGNVYDYLTVIERAGTKNGYATWWCQCKCGNTVEVKGINLRRHGTKSCGCMQKEHVQKLNKNKLIDLVGQKFGRLTVLKRGQNRGDQPTWVCKCECGSILEVPGGNLRKHDGTLSCGCINSKGEFKIAQILNDHKILFEKEFKIKDCVSYSGAQLKFDFAIIDNNKLKYLIEYQGQQHYKDNSFMDHDHFYLRIIRDIIKKEYCSKNNIPLIIIPYTYYEQITIDDLLLEKTQFLYNGEKKKMKTLIVVDCQRDFIDGVLGTPEAIKIIPNIKKKIEEYVACGDEIIFTRDAHFNNYLDTMEGKKLPVEHCIYGTRGWEIPDELFPNASYPNIHIVNKNTFGSYELALQLQELFTTEDANCCNEIEIIGFATDICVISNVLLLQTNFRNWLEITVDASCCAGTTPEKHEAALQVMKSCQINVIE